MNTSGVWVVDSDGAARVLVASDRGLSYGDGVFETMRVSRERIPALDAHLARMQHGLTILGIPDVTETIRQCLPAWLNAADRAVMKIIVTRGPGGRGYLPPDSPSPSIVATLDPLPEYPQEVYQTGVNVCRPAVTLSSNPLLAGIKHLNRLEQVLARRDIDNAGCREGMMFDGAGRLIEGVYSNVFLRHGETLSTPRLDQSGVAGIMRSWVLQHAPGQGVRVVEAHLKEEDIESADEVFLTNSLFGIWPVRRYEECSWESFDLSQRLWAALKTTDAGF